MADKIKSASRKIESEFETPQLLSDVVYSLAQDEEKRKSCLSLLETAVRYICFMDLYQETGDEDYRGEYERHRTSLFAELDVEDQRKLKEVEDEILYSWNYWNLERSLKRRIQVGSHFSEQEAEDYILKKSGDAVLYGTIAGLHCDLPSGLIGVIHKRQALADLVDDVKDYEEDLESRQPNIMVLYFLNQGVSNYPNDFQHALEISKELGITEKIIRFGEKLCQTALDVKERNQIHLLKQGIEDKYHLLRRLLDNVQ